MHTYSQPSLLQRYTTQKMFCLDTAQVRIHEPRSWVNTVKAKVEKDYITLISIHTELTGDLTTFILMLAYASALYVPLLQIFSLHNPTSLCTWEVRLVWGLAEFATEPEIRMFRLFYNKRDDDTNQTI